MPESENRAQSVYDREAEFPHDESRSGRRRRPVADWGGDELFTRMPRRRSGHVLGQRRFARPDAEACDAPHGLDPEPHEIWAASHGVPREPEDSWAASHVVPREAEDGWANPHDVSREAEDSWANPHDVSREAEDSWANPHDVSREAEDSWANPRDLSREAEDSWANPRDLSRGPQRDVDRPENGEPGGDWAREPEHSGAAHTLPSAAADSPAPAVGPYDHPSGSGQAPPRPAGGGTPAGVPGRRTVVIGRSGRPAHRHHEAPFGSVSRRRPPPTVAERIGGRPERIVAWAFALGLILILIAIATAQA